MSNHEFKQVLNMWLRNIKDVYRLHRNELDVIADEDTRAGRLCELNVKEQAMNLAKTSIIEPGHTYRFLFRSTITYSILSPVHFF